MNFTTTIPENYEGNLIDWFLAIQPPRPGALTFHSGLKTPQPDNYARAGAMKMVPASLLPSLVAENRAGASWSWAPVADAHARLRGTDSPDAEQLRRLQEQVAAQRSTLDLVLERARQIVDITRRNEG